VVQKRIQTISKGNALSPEVSSPGGCAGQSSGISQPPSGLESLSDLGPSTPPPGAQGLLGGGLLAMTLDVMLGQILWQPLFCGCEQSRETSEPTSAHLAAVDGACRKDGTPVRSGHT
jgi:hypothetical protein